MTPRVLLIADVRGWAFDVNLRDLASYLRDRFGFEFWYMQDGMPSDLVRYDAIYAAYRWDLPPGFPYGRAIGSLRCSIFRPEAPGPPTAEDTVEANRWGAFQVVNREVYDALKPHCPRVAYLTNPVDARRFDGAAPEHLRTVASWSGNARHISPAGVDVKGFESIVLPACRRANVPLVYAEQMTRKVLPAQMPDFYRSGNVTLCASLYEGASNSVMEAMAMGHAIISTDAGNIRELDWSERENMGASGIVIVERSVDAFAKALGELTLEQAKEMGALNRREIQPRWSWDAWADRYAALLGEVCRR